MGKLVVGLTFISLCRRRHPTKISHQVRDRSVDDTEEKDVMGGGEHNFIVCNCPFSPSKEVYAVLRKATESSAKIPCG